MQYLKGSELLRPYPIPREDAELETIEDCSCYFGISPQVIRSRLKLGWSLDKALLTAVRGKKSTKRSCEKVVRLEQPYLFDLAA